MSIPAKLFYNGFESKRKAIAFAVKCLRENKLVTQEAEIYYEDTVWDTLPDGAINTNETYDFSTPTPEAILRTVMRAVCESLRSVRITTPSNT